MAGKSGAGACSAQSAHVRSAARTHHHAPSPRLSARDRGRRARHLRPAPGWRVQRASRRAECGVPRRPSQEATAQHLRLDVEEPQADQQGP